MWRTAAVTTAVSLVLTPLVAPVASADSIVVKRKLERTIGKGFKKQAGLRVRVKCPKRISWEKGKVFYCKVRARNGAKYRVKVRLGSERKGALRWKVVA